MTPTITKNMVSVKLNTPPSSPKKRKIYKTEPAATLFIDLIKNISLVSLPSKWYADVDNLPGYTTNQFILGFHQLSSFRDGFLRSIKKQIVMTKDSSIFIHIYGKEVAVEDVGLSSNKPSSIEELSDIIKLIDSVKVCEGSVSVNKYKEIEATFKAEYVKSFDRWRHSNCTRIIDNSSRSTICIWCKRISYYIKNKLRRRKPKSLKV